MPSKSPTSQKEHDRKAQSNASGSVRSGAPAPQVFVGTSGWSYPSWKPGFYPQKTPQTKFLEYYASQLNSVEVNYTFRRLPNESMLAKWLAASHSAFRFSFKAPERMTHILRLEGCESEIAAFARALAPAVESGRMGVVLFQLPPNFKANFDRLESFLQVASGSGLRLAFEFRNATWFCEETFSVLRGHNAALCVAESPDLQTPDITTASFSCYRLRKSDNSDAKIAEVAAILRRRSTEGEVFAYFKHEDEPTGALSALKVLSELTDI